MQFAVTVTHYNTATGYTKNDAIQPLTNTDIHMQTFKLITAAIFLSNNKGTAGERKNDSRRKRKKTLGYFFASVTGCTFLPTLGVHQEWKDDEVLTSLQLSVSKREIRKENLLTLGC